MLVKKPKEFTWKAALNADLSAVFKDILFVLVSFSETEATPGYQAVDSGEMKELVSMNDKLCI